MHFSFFFLLLTDVSLRYLLPLVRSTDVQHQPEGQPVEETHNGELNELEVLFGILDNEQERLRINNYTLECTTLEQIFLEMERQAVNDPSAQKLLAKVGLKDYRHLRPIEVSN